MGLKAIPQLPSDDFDKTAGFYRPLGFVERSRWDREYLIMARPADGLELHFWFSDQVDPLRNDASCYVRWDTAEEARGLYDEWSKVGMGTDDLRPPVETDYGLLEFALIDKHGNLIRIGGAIGS